MDELTRKRMAKTLLMQSGNVAKPLPPLKKAENKESTNNSIKRIDCRNCIYFFVTWEKNCPYGCKAYGFKGPQIPSVVVKQSSRENCSFFRQRE